MKKAQYTKIILILITVLSINIICQAKQATILIVPIKGKISKNTFYLFRRAFTKESKKHNPVAIILDIDTPGGLVYITQNMLDLINNSTAPVYAYVNTRATSAGAIISLGCKQIYMAPGSHIGSATPIILDPLGGVKEIPKAIRSKFMADFLAMVRALAEKNNHNPALAEAMIDMDKEVIIGNKTISKKGEILNLTAKEATEIIPPNSKPLLAKTIAKNISAIIADLQIQNAKIIKIKPCPAEKIATIINSWGWLFLSIGLLAIFTELKIPGFGVFGITGITFLAIFFFGNNIAGLAGIEEIILVAVGFILIALEIFVIPGFGIAGITGIACLFSGIILTMIPQLSKINDTNYTLYLNPAAKNFILMVISIGIGVWLLSKILPKTPLFNKIILNNTLSKKDGYIAGADYSSYLGKEGISITVLRPAGIIKIDNKHLDVVSSGEMIAAKQAIKVIKIEGTRIVVEPILT